MSLKTTQPPHQGPQAEKEATGTLKRSASSILFGTFAGFNSSLSIQKNKLKVSIKSIFSSKKSSSTTNLLLLDEPTTVRAPRLSFSAFKANNIPTSTSLGYLPSSGNVLANEMSSSATCPSTRSEAILLAESIFDQVSQTLSKDFSQKKTQSSTMLLGLFDLPDIPPCRLPETPKTNLEKVDNNKDINKNIGINENALLSSCVLSSMTSAIEQDSVKEAEMKRIHHLMLETPDQEPGNTSLNEEQVPSSNLKTSPPANSFSSLIRRTSLHHQILDVALETPAFWIPHFQNEVHPKELLDEYFPVSPEDINGDIPLRRSSSRILHRSKSFIDRHVIVTPESLEECSIENSSLSPPDLNIENAAETYLPKVPLKRTQRKSRGRGSNNIQKDIPFLYIDTSLEENDLDLDAIEIKASDNQRKRSPSPPRKSPLKRRLSFTLSGDEDVILSPSQNLDTDFINDSDEKLMGSPVSETTTDHLADSPEKITVSPESPVLLISSELESLSLKQVLPEGGLEATAPTEELDTLPTIGTSPSRKWNWVKHLYMTFREIPEKSNNYLSKQEKLRDKADTKYSKLRTVPTSLNLGTINEIRQFDPADMKEQRINGRLGFPSHVEKFIYRLSHVKLTQLKRPLNQQVLISNLMISILGAHADLNLGNQPVKFLNNGITKKSQRKGSRSAASTTMQPPRTSSFRRPGRKSMDTSRDIDTIHATTAILNEIEPEKSQSNGIPIVPLLIFDRLPIPFEDNDIQGHLKIDTLKKNKSFEIPSGSKRAERKNRRKSLSASESLPRSPGHSVNRLSFSLSNSSESNNNNEEDDDIPLAVLKNTKTPLNPSTYP